ncbi:MAG: hypothetical protein ACK5RL_12910 [Acidimicrobiales bacterium]
MPMFAVTLNDDTTDIIEGADAYQQEGPMTTFFAFEGGRRVIDSWSVRMASFRTADIAAIRRRADVARCRSGHPDHGHGERCRIDSGIDAGLAQLVSA